MYFIDQYLKEVFTTYSFPELLIFFFINSSTGVFVLTYYLKVRSKYLKVRSLKTSSFWTTLPPCSFLFVLHVHVRFTCQRTFALVSYPPLKKISANTMTLISNKKSGGAGWKELTFLQTQHKISMFFTQLYLYKYFIYIILYIFLHIYLHVHKKTFLKKKCLRLFN